MKKFVFLIVMAVMLSSCGKVPQERLDIAYNCIDSLKNLGAYKCLAFSKLEVRFLNANKEVERQKSMLFKKFGPIIDTLDNIVYMARHFAITNDVDTKVDEMIKNSHASTVRLRVEIDFDMVKTNDDALKIAGEIDEAVRRSLNTRAKLIRVNVE